MVQEKVLLVDDARSTHLIVESALNGICNLSWVGSLAAAREEIKKNSYALVILDVYLPDGNGFEFFEQLSREAGKASVPPVIFLTGESAVDRKVHGFHLGAEDYVVKPLEPVEFAARVKAKLKRKSLLSSTLEVNGLKLDLQSQRAYLKEEGEESKELHLTPIEFKLLAHFVRHKESIVSRETILSEIWGKKVHITHHTIDTHISSLRKKLGSYGGHIKAIVKKGYCFTLLN